jgi:hypothetical protein
MSDERSYTPLAYESAPSYGASGPRWTASSEAVALLGGGELCEGEGVALDQPEGIGCVK